MSFTWSNPRRLCSCCDCYDVQCWMLLVRNECCGDWQVKICRKKNTLIMSSCGTSNYSLRYTTCYTLCVVQCYDVMNIFRLVRRVRFFCCQLVAKPACGFFQFCLADLFWSCWKELLEWLVWVMIPWRKQKVCVIHTYDTYAVSVTWYACDTLVLYQNIWTYWADPYPRIYCWDVLYCIDRG